MDRLAESFEQPSEQQKMLFAFLRFSSALFVVMQHNLGCKMALKNINAPPSVGNAGTCFGTKIGSFTDLFGD